MPLTLTLIRNRWVRMDWARRHILGLRSGPGRRPTGMLRLSDGQSWLGLWMVKRYLEMPWLVILLWSFTANRNLSTGPGVTVRWSAMLGLWLGPLGTNLVNSWQCLAASGISKVPGLVPCAYFAYICKIYAKYRPYIMINCREAWYALYILHILHIAGGSLFSAYFLYILHIFYIWFCILFCISFFFKVFCIIFADSLIRSRSYTLGCSIRETCEYSSPPRYHWISRVPVGWVVFCIL